jgi:ribosomal protein L11 methyltransferase
VLTYQIRGSLDSLDDLTPALWDAGCLGLEERGDFVVAYFDTRVELPFDGQWLEADDTDWLETYRKSLRPVKIGRIVVNPGWDLSLEPDSETIIIDLEPGLAFGTGQHETTRLAIGALQRLELSDKRVLDVGAGSGILGIVAAKLGASVVGVDNDASTVRVAQENAAKNNVSAEFLEGILETVLPRTPFDVLVCNLFAELHDALMGQYRQALEDGGHLILTGILAGTERADADERVTWDTSSGREVLVLEALKREGFALLKREQAGDWVLLEARKDVE